MEKQTCPKCGRYCEPCGVMLVGTIALPIYQCLECLVEVHDGEISVPPEERLPSIEIALTFTFDQKTGQKIVAGDPFSAS